MNIRLKKASLTANQPRILLLFPLVASFPQIPGCSPSFASQDSPRDRLQAVLELVSTRDVSFAGPSVGTAVLPMFLFHGSTKPGEHSDDAESLPGLASVFISQITAREKINSVYIPR